MWPRTNDQQTRGENIMSRYSLLTRSTKALLTHAAIAVLGIAFMQASQAGCGQYDQPAKSAVDWRLPSSSGSPRFIHADYRADYRLVADEVWSVLRAHSQPPLPG